MESLLRIGEVRLAAQTLAALGRPPPELMLPPGTLLSLFLAGELQVSRTLLAGPPVLRVQELQQLVTVLLEVARG